MSLDADLVQTDRQGEDAPPPAQEDVTQEAASVVDDDKALDEFIERESIPLPDGTEKLVPLSAVTTLRGKLSDAKKELDSAKEGSAKAQQLETTVAQLQQQISQMQPLVAAYQAALIQPPQQTAPPEDIAELEEVARDFDFYKSDGSLDLDKARRHNARVEKQASKIADSRVKPLEQQSVAQQSSYMKERAKATTFPNGMKADPAMVDLVWSNLDPAVTATEQGAKFAAIQALGMSVGTNKAQPTGPQRGTDGKFVKAEEIPPPLHTEKAGGKDAPDVRSLDESDRKAIKAMGISEKEYLEIASSRPKGVR